jgi:two-component system OmpR family sensor kinase
MKKSSIFISIIFIYLLAIIGVVVAYFYMAKYDKQRYSQELNNRYSIVSRATLYRLISEPINNQFKQELSAYSMRLIIDKLYIEQVLQNGEVLQKLTSSIGSSSIYYYNKNNYLLIESLNKNAILLEDQAYSPYRAKLNFIQLLFGGILMLIIILYLLTYRKIKPIKKLKKDLEKFAEGNLNIDAKMDGDDEIAELANAFDHSVEQIRKLNNSRVLLLRNIMHELKTPITKGRITAEMIDNEKHKDRLISVFQRLESLLNEFTAIEEISAKGNDLNKRVYRLVDIIDEAIDISMTNPDNIERIIPNELSLKVDFKLFSIAIKNMIDNGIKYSPDNKVKIISTKNALHFSSKGKKLEHELSYYIEPFTKGNENSSQSFGLGLYIVDNILNAHNIKFVYGYHNGYNVFKFDKIMPIV